MKHYPALAHGPIEPVFEDIWFVKGAVKMPMFVPMKISRSMTVLRIPGTSDLVVVNSMRLSEKGHEELDALGQVKHVIRIAGYHGRDDAYYKERYGAQVHAIEGQRYFRAMEAKGSVEDYMAPDSSLNELSELPLPGARLIVMKSSSPPEALLLLERDGGILVTGDSLQNTPEPDEFVNFPAKLMMRKMGFYHPFLVGPAWLQFAKPSADEVRAIADIQFENVLPGHGDPVMGEAKEKYLPALQGPLKGCHS